MFSRSDKTEEVAEAAFAEGQGERSPMVLAALAGLLAIAGAFLLVWYLNGRSDTSDAITDGGENIEATQTETRQVLVVTQTIPRGTSLREIVNARTTYLSAEVYPVEAVAASAISNVQDLEEFAAESDSFTLTSDVLPGEQLLRGRFADVSNFENESFLETTTVVDAPPGHHQVVLTLPAAQALGGNIRAGDEVTVVSGFQYSPVAIDTESGQSTNLPPVKISIVVLNSIEVTKVDNFGTPTGQAALDINDVGLANQGTYVVTVAVEPDELTDLTYAVEYGEIYLVEAIEGVENDNAPRAVTAIEHIIGDDGIWLNEIEDGNIVDLLGVPDFAATSIDFDVPSSPDAIDPPVEDDEGLSEDPEADLATEEEPADS